MSSTKTPTSSLSGSSNTPVPGALLDMQSQRPNYSSCEFGTELEPEFGNYPLPAPNLPQEAVERIVAHLVYYTPSLLACSLTCYSWCIAAVPHLHHTLVILNCRHYGEPKRQWPEPIRNAGRFGLLPLVKRVQVCRASIYHPHEGLHPRLFDRDTLRHFSALSNVQVFDSILETCHRHSDLSPSVNPKGPAGNFYSSSGYFSICKTLSSSIAHLPISRVSWRKSRRSLHYRDG